MKRATDFQFTITLDEGTANLTKFRMAFSQQGEVLLLKTESQLEINDTSVICNLTQEETKLFEANIDCAIQLRAKNTDGKVFATNEFYEAVEGVLDDEVM